VASPLLTTKLNIPSIRPELVSRPRLIERLNAGLSCRLLLVSAPAGYGKTTILSEWAHHSELRGRIAWVSLDKNDNDPVIFWDYFVTALKGLKIGIGEDVSALLHSSQRPPIEAILTILINRVNAIQGDLVLVLDDYHSIEFQPINEAISFLLEHLPLQMHLIIATREDPSLPLARLRAGGLMVEIRADDLRFMPDEVSIFLNRVMGVDISKVDLMALETRTEGWIAGLQMAALSMRGQKDIPSFVKSFTASHRYILDYLIEEVFQRQPADVQDFLLKTSILDRLIAPLCDFVTKRNDSRDMLPTLERANLFIVPLDESRQWYRYEHLFADLLQHQLDIMSTVEDVSTLHARASQWYEKNGIIADAVYHAIASRDWERVVTLIKNTSNTLMKRGEVTTLASWIKALPEEVVCAHSELLDNYIWALILSGQIEAAEYYIKQFEKAAKDALNIDSKTVTMRAYIARVQGDNRRTIQLSEQALSLLPQGDFETRCIVALNLGIARWQSGQLEEAAEAFTETDHCARESGNEYAAVTAKSFLGAIQATHGRLHRAVDILQEAVRLTTSPSIALSCIYLGALLYERNELKAAADQIQRGIQLSQQSNNIEIQIGGYRVLAYVLQALNDASGALDALQKADSLTRSTNASALEYARNASSHVIVALAQRDLPAALDWTDRMPEDADVSPFYPRINFTLPRVLIAQNRKTEASERLHLCYQRAVESNWRYAQVEARLLQAMATNNAEESLVFLADALQLAQPEGYIRTFVDKGEKLISLLHKTRSQGIAPDYVAELLTILNREVEERRQKAGTPTPVTTQPLSEPLSERELEVLRLLSAGLSNREIAKKLIISVGTAKTHVHNIIGKLNVSGRTQAIARARELNLI
jgi:LuxR family maltose regulon positive regulatory protein